MRPAGQHGPARHIGPRPGPHNFNLFIDCCLLLLLSYIGVCCIYVCCIYWFVLFDLAASICQVSNSSAWNPANMSPDPGAFMLVLAVCF